MEAVGAVRGIRELEDEIRGCTRCPLHKARTNAVPGEGPVPCDVMVVGEAPGRNEDLQGRPFVGAAGRLLNSLLAKAGYPRERVYITNVVKCRPPGNRDPSREEIASCRGYLLEQVRLVRPRVIIAVGRIAGEVLYREAGLKWPGIRQARARPVKARIAGVEVTLIVTYHPAAALYNPELRGELERDFSTVIRRSLSGGGTRSLEEFM